MRNCFTFFKILAFLLLSTSIGARANYGKAYKLATNLDHASQIDLAAEILRNVLATAKHGSKYRAARIKENISKIAMALNSLINPADNSENTPSLKKIHGPNTVRYGEKRTEDGSPVIFTDREYLDQDHIIYIHAPLDFQLEPLDLKYKKISNVITLIRRSEENVKKLIKESK